MLIIGTRSLNPADIIQLSSHFLAILKPDQTVVFRFLACKHQTKFRHKI